MKERGRDRASEKEMRRKRANNEISSNQLETLNDIVLRRCVHCHCMSLLINFNLSRLKNNREYQSNNTVDKKKPKYIKTYPRVKDEN